MVQAGAKGRKAEYLAEEITRELRSDIISGRYGVGEKLPTENALGERFGVSRTVVREAVAGLRAAGLVSSRRGSGVFVAKAIPNDQVASGNGSFLLGDWPKRVPEVIEILELRSAVEVQAARLAAERSSLAQIENIHEKYAAFSEKASAGKNAEQEDFAFHQSIAKATNNKYFEEFLLQLGQRTIPRTSLRVNQDSQAYAQYIQKLNEEHLAILQAVEGRDAGAAGDAMGRHLLGSLERYRAAARRTG